MTNMERRDIITTVTFGLKHQKTEYLIQNLNYNQDMPTTEEKLIT